MAISPLVRRGSGARPFRVRAADAEDVRVISAYLQDAIVPYREVVYQPQEKRFALIAQRFRWEKPAEAAPEGEDDAGAGDATVSNAPRFERVHCALRFEQVGAVRSHRVDRGERGQMLELLAITAGDGVIDLAFAEDKTIRLEVDRIDVHAEDLGEPWPTVNEPRHPDEPDMPDPDMRDRDAQDAAGS